MVTLAKKHAKATALGSSGRFYSIFGNVAFRPSKVKRLFLAGDMSCVKAESFC